MMIMGLPKPRVFVSSVIDGYEEYRDAARRGIVEAGAEPVLVEDLSAQDETPRNTCLDLVASCDAVVVLIGARAGWRTPSGQLAVEEETEFARRRGVPILVFLEETDREKEAEELAGSLGEYAGGRFRKTFRTAIEVARLVKESVSDMKSVMGCPERDATEVKDLSELELEQSDEVVLRIVVAPERDEEVIDPARLQDEALVRAVLEAGHRDGVDFFSYLNADQVERENDWLVIRELAVGQRTTGGEIAVIQLRGDGTLVLESRVTGRHVDDDGRADFNIESNVLSEEALESELMRCLRLIDALAEIVDPYGCHQRFFYRPVLLNVGYRTYEQNPQPRDSFEVRMRGSEGTMTPLLDAPRLITREALGSPGEEVSRLLAEANRKLS